MTQDSIVDGQLPKVMEVYLQLANYPIMAERVRSKMRKEIFARGIVTREVFEAEVEERAIASQQREGIDNPYGAESIETWERRKQLVRDHLTDFYFGYNLPARLLQDLIHAEIGRHDDDELGLTFNPELAPWDALFAKGLQYEALPPDERVKYAHHLSEIKAVLIKAMISDQLGFVGIARRYFTIADLNEIRRHRVGRGKIGGKAAGLMLAWKILSTDPEIARAGFQEKIDIPDSYFVGSDVFYEFLDINGLLQEINQKYKSPEEMIEDYHSLPQRFAEGYFPERVVLELKQLLVEVGNAPLIVRSSSLLEDNVNTSFAGKYDSIFSCNQGTLEENLRDLLWSISQVYVSALNPDALLYRRQMGLIDYDERMAVIIQPVKGEKYRDLFFPTVSGVGFSRNPFLWTPRLRRDEGFVRLVTGLGTRAVDRVPDDYPRMIGLSHPTLRPAQTAREIQHYSQRYMDVIDLEANDVRTVSVRYGVDGEYPWLRLLGAAFRDGQIQPVRSSIDVIESHELVLTLDGLVAHTAFVERMKLVLKTLENAYAVPVDVEFTLEFSGSLRAPELIIHLLQCRPQSSHEQGQRVEIPTQTPEGDVLFTANDLIPNGVVDQLGYIVYVDPHQYSRLALPSEKLEVARAIGRLNRDLEGERFILVGPGRWGSSNLDLGVKVTYADVFNTKVLVELGYDHGSGAPEVSYGTHFFQDLVEARIFPLAVFPEQQETTFNRRFLAEAANKLAERSPADAALDGVIKVIDVAETRGGQLLEVVMSGDQEHALAYFRRYD
ncbi:MAG: PEP/pyruvate-binding domain-containing protein [Anaerolineae bacterium]|nr:PEP/pyruvate-binding domain-containing protein [Anaerolineae bacterium]